MKTPRLRVFAGPNGSGKSTIKDKVASLNPNWLGVYINPDEIEKDITERGFIDLADFKLKAKAKNLLGALEHAKQLADNNLLSKLGKLTARGSKLWFPANALNSYFVSAIADFLHEKLAGSRVSFSFETVMSHPNKIELLKYARRRGFRNYLYFIATEASEINISRVRIRVKAGGHPVPEEKIVSRYHRSLDNLLPAVLETDRAFIFDNSGAKAYLVAEVTAGKTVEIMNQNVPLWFNKHFLDKIG